VINTTLDGFMYSYLDYKNRERLLTSTFGVTKSKAKRYFGAQNNLIRREHVKAHKLYAVTISVTNEIRSFEQPQKDAPL